MIYTSTKRFDHILYMIHVPSYMKTAMVDQSGHVFYTCNSLFCLGISHGLESFLNPGIAYLVYHFHRSLGETLEEIITWNNIIAISYLCCFAVNTKVDVLYMIEGDIMESVDECKTQDTKET